VLSSWGCCEVAVTVVLRLIRRWLAAPSPKTFVPSVGQIGPVRIDPTPLAISLNIPGGLTHRIDPSREAIELARKGRLSLM
jgi:hypothetical protein